MTPEDGDEPHIETNMRHGAISEGEKIKTEMMDATLSAQHSGRANEVIFASGRQEELEEVRESEKKMRIKPISHWLRELSEEKLWQGDLDLKAAYFDI